MDKYGITDNAQLVGRIYTDWMTLLTAKARPLFYFNRSVWREEQTAKLAFVSIPESSAPIKAAAALRYKTDPTWDCRDSVLVDGISAVTVLVGFPICAGGYVQKCTTFTHTQV